MTDPRFSAAAVAAPATLAILVGATTYVTQQSTAAELTSEAADQSPMDVTRDGPHDAVAVALQRAVRQQDHQLNALQKRLESVRSQTRAVQRGATSSVSVSSSGGTTWSAPTASSPSIPNQPAAAPQSSTTTTHTTTGASGATVP